MNIASKYSIETLPQLLRGDEINKDLLDLYIQQVLRSVENQELILSKLDLLQETANVINSKIDIVLEKLTNLENDFIEVRKAERNIEETLFLLSAKLNKLDIDKKDLEEYYALAQREYMNWDDFDELTKQFIPIAEYLYSKLRSYEKEDFSPVILELCRAIENEFLLKVFKSYILELIDRVGDLDAFLCTDRSFCDKTKTSTFMKIITRAKKTRKPEISLGQMYFVLSACCDCSKLSLSPLLQDFKRYLEKNTESKRLLDPQYIEKIYELVDKFRNPSAHPNKMSLKQAQKCRTIMPDRLDYFIECVLS